MKASVRYRYPKLSLSPVRGKNSALASEQENTLPQLSAEITCGSNAPCCSKLNTPCIILQHCGLVKCLNLKDFGGFFNGTMLGR